MLDRLYICATCVRDAPLAPGEASRGQRLITAVRRLLEDGTLAKYRLALRQVHCLNGCPSPCNVSLRGQAKYTLRFSRLTPAHASAVVAFYHAYVAAESGDVPEEQWPEGLQGKLTVRTPPPHLLFGDRPKESTAPMRD